MSFAQYFSHTVHRLCTLSIRFTVMYNDVLFMFVKNYNILCILCSWKSTVPINLKDFHLPSFSTLNKNAPMVWLYQQIIIVVRYSELWYLSALIQKSRSFCVWHHTLCGTGCMLCAWWTVPQAWCNVKKIWLMRIFV